MISKGPAWAFLQFCSVPDVQDADDIWWHIYKEFQSLQIVFYECPVFICMNNG